MGAEALIEAMELVENGSAQWVEQNEDGLTYAQKLAKDELDCAPTDTVAGIEAKVRVASDSRPAKAQIAGRTIAIERAIAVGAGDLPADGLPGCGEAALVSKRLLIGASDGALELSRVKPDGKKSMDGRAFAAGIQGIKGTRVEWGRA